MLDDTQAHAAPPASGAIRPTMKIVHFTNTYPPSLNGVANVTHFYRRGPMTPSSTATARCSCPARWTT